MATHHLRRRPGDATAPGTGKRGFTDIRHGLLLGLVAGSCGIGVSAPGVVLPHVAHAFGEREGVTAWVLAAFSLGIGVATTLSGRALDNVGPRRVMSVGVAGTLLGTVMIALAPAFSLLVAGRFVQGMGEGALCIVSFSGTDTFGVESRARISGVLTGVSFSLIATGSLVGALVNDLAGWRATLCASIVIVLWLPALAPKLPETRHSGTPMDLPGAMLATVIAACIAGILQAPATHSPALVNAAVAAAGVLATLLFIRRVKRRPNAFLPLAILRNRQLIRLSLAAASIQASYTGLVYAAPLLLARHHGWSELDTGIVLAPGAIMAVAAANLAGTLGSGVPAARLLRGVGRVSALGLLSAGIGGHHTVLVVLGSLLAIGPYACAQAVMLDRSPQLVDADNVGTGIGTFMYLFITGGAVGAAAVGGLASATSLTAAVVICTALPLLGQVALVRMNSSG